MTLEEIVPLLKEFVRRNSNVPSIQWDRQMEPKLLLNPYSTDYKERKKTAHYFLMVASVLEYKVVGRAENARRLLVYLHKTLGNRLFEASKSSLFKSAVRKCGFYDELGPLKEEIPQILASVNRFVKQKAEGDLIEYSRCFNNPKDMVREIAGNVERMGGSLEDKSWMYMKWMARPYPDLRILNCFSPRDLFIPLTIDTASVAMSLGLIDRVNHSLWENKQRAARARECLTNFSKQLFPEDPARADYPFFLMGRWLKGKNLDIKTLKESLQLFDHLYKVTGYAHVIYQVMERYKSGWEKKIADTLSKMKIPFRFEGIRFPLPHNIFYTPDFILSELTVQGKKVILEPHYQMTERDIHKFSLFKQNYGKSYFLILLMRNDDIAYYRARHLLREEAYDDVWPIGYVHILLEQIKRGTYTRIV